MKKITFVLFLIMLWGVSVASAEINRGQDSFTGYGTIKSCIYDEREIVTKVDFKKVLSPDMPTYELSLIGQGHKKIRNFILSNSPTEIKVDENPAYKLSPSNYSIKQVPGSYEKILSQLTFELPVENIDGFKNAKRIALRITMEDGTRYIYVLPAPVLAEWKQVISTEE